jgi:hypothetical protein
MRIHEILFWSNDSAEGDPSDPYFDFPPGPPDHAMADLARAAFPKDGRVKRLWGLNRLQRLPSEATASAETELSPSDNLEPPFPRQSDSIETDPPLGPNGLAPSRQYPRLHLGRP